MGGAAVVSADNCKGRQIAKHSDFVPIFTGYCRGHNFEYRSLIPLLSTVVISNGC